uniref:UPAR/Ly6 domain-containing protein n=1 Tax=Takifugu rubripes TaxID=31033 RepID=A0A674PNL4_TAKRU
SRPAACHYLLMITFTGEALRCNYCFANACGAVILGSPLNSSFRQCMNMAVCQGYIKNTWCLASCCSTDLCN